MLLLYGREFIPGGLVSKLIGGKEECNPLSGIKKGGRTQFGRGPWRSSQFVNARITAWRSG
ncbi:MAG: hypothetical protein A2Z86_02240 [Candidatus Glassbacteria bacterium GWA2_58_10]|uniref:Uncharacterized protein n=1 Tax=Candidatus Glassbacteria bacterium GWA2_58_10 TaxID=1817865 RepID=A0A1F5YHX2_9BACT|nr:MAG: hypothetical protein A2Z86_02240 [Candidatus Glassbacteria bacterium GWA2_58_10]